MATVPGDLQAVGVLGWWQPDTAGAPAAPTLTLVGTTSTTITVQHTPPGDAVYARTRIYLSSNNADPVEAAQSVTSEQVTLTGLTPATRYAVFAVAESARGERSPSSDMLIVTTDPV